MGEHKHNPRAIAAAQPAIRFAPGDEIFGFSFETVIELNKAKMAEVVALVDAARANGHDPRHAVPAFNPKENPEFFDYVVYNRPTVGRPSPLLPDPRQIPTAQIRAGENLRIPLVELKQRADVAFSDVERPDGVH
jgi:hypothetical protein